MNIDEKTAYIKDFARTNIGLDVVGITPADFLPDEEQRLQRWLDLGYNADMGYMERNVDKRLDPRLLVEGARSVISVLVSYANIPASDYKSPRVARYAKAEDYHKTVKDMLYRLLEEIRRISPTASGRAFTDSAPVLERTLAAKAGLGWIGRSSMLINERLGSYLFIGELITNEEFVYDETPVENRCGSCRRCVNSCPTGAITEDGVDARKCIAYHTIENKGEIPENITAALDNWVFGCDICTEVCPWNYRPEVSSVIKPVLEIDNVDWATISEAEFAERFGETPLARAGLDKIRSHLCYTTLPCR